MVELGHGPIAVSAYLVLEQVQTNGRLASGRNFPLGSLSTVDLVPNERLTPIVTTAACKCPFRPSTECATVRNICHDGVIANDVPATQIQKTGLGDLVVMNPLIARKACMKEVVVQFKAAVRVHPLPCGHKRDSRR